ncbi:sigma 54-interacting transcriptional regulator [Nitrospira defluvii]|nr:sigma 54-interacting transcriptional regulator [Nitrospira defluvii]
MAWCEEDLLCNKAMFNFLLRRKDDAIIFVNQKQRVTLINSFVTKLFGYESKDLIGKKITVLYASPEEHEKHGKLQYTPFIKEGLAPFQVLFKKKNGAFFCGETLVAKVYDKKEDVIGFKMTIKDITEQEKIEKNLRNAKAARKHCNSRLETENVYLQDEIKITHHFDEIISNNKDYKRILEKVKQVAETDTTVLILGETGTGKGLLARAIHNISQRKDRPFVKINCAALPVNLIESELFGHEMGAFTGAVYRKIGRFELADRGTIFLDEIGDLPLELQGRLLRILQDREFERLGGLQTIKTDIRIIAATNRDLESAIENGDFRQDLYYRLNVFPITSPPLRERKNDIPFLVKHFVRTYSLNTAKKIKKVTRTTLDALRAYDWPGNVRELENIIERAVIISQGETLTLGDGFPGKRRLSVRPKIATLEALNRIHIRDVLDLTGWRVSGEGGAAKILGLQPTTLEARMKKMGIRRRK